MHMRQLLRGDIVALERIDVPSPNKCLPPVRASIATSRNQAVADEAIKNLLLHTHPKRRLTNSQNFGGTGGLLSTQIGDR